MHSQPRFLRCTLLFAAFLAVAALLPSTALAQVRVETEDTAVDFKGRVQPGYSVRFLHDEGGTEPRFFVNKARFTVDVAVRDQFGGQIEIGFAGNRGIPSVKDAYLTWTPLHWIELKLGQFKVPMSGQRLISSKKLLFPKRSDATSDFVAGRDIGAMLSLSTPLEHYRFSVGVFNGRGVNVVKDDDLGYPLAAARFVAMPLGYVSSGEGDVGRSQRFGLGLGVNASYTHDQEPLGGAEDPNPLHSIAGKKVQYGGDVTIKYKGLFASAEALFAYYEPDLGEAYYAAGVVGQASYYIHPVRLEPAVRVSYLNPSDLVPDDRQLDLAFGLTTYPFADHNVKAAVNFLYHLPATSDATNGWKENELLFLALIAF